MNGSAIGMYTCGYTKVQNIKQTYTTHYILMN